ncbi:MAG TPA: ABC transporter permease subunit [Firmicutes bacterium]|nr:ABC transporter permease subunit [Bacillota bacterium]
MKAIYHRELQAYFSSPAGYVFIGFFLLISGFFFALTNLLPGNSDYIDTLGSITFIFLIVVPLLTMKLLAEEMRHKTDQLLLTSPLRIADIVVGKYLAAVTVFLLTLLITGIYPVIMNFYGYIAVWEIVGGYIGFFLLGACFISVGLFISSLTNNQAVAAVATFATLLFIWIIDWVKQAIPTSKVAGLVFAGLLVAGVTALFYLNLRNILATGLTGLLGVAVVVGVYMVNPLFYHGLTIRFLDWFSLLQRFQGFAMGVLSLSSVFYYLSFCFAFIFLTIRVIEKRRWS